MAQSQHSTFSALRCGITRAKLLRGPTNSKPYLAPVPRPFKPAGSGFRPGNPGETALARRGRSRGISTLRRAQAPRAGWDSRCPCLSITFGSSVPFASSHSSFTPSASLSRTRRIKSRPREALNSPTREPGSTGREAIDCSARIFMVRKNPALRACLPLFDAAGGRAPPSSTTNPSKTGCFVKHRAREHVKILRASSSAGVRRA